LAARVRISRRARRDLDEIADYLLARSPAAALRFAEVVNDIFDILGRYPHLGSKNRRLARVRTWLIAGFPYRLHYCATSDGIEILHIRHTARRDWDEEQ
jgi:plasmid stabilization system protein ParE